MVGEGTPSDGDVGDGDAEGEPVAEDREPEVDGGRVDGSPVTGSRGAAPPNGCGVSDGDGVPPGDGDCSVGESDGSVGCVRTWASPGPAVSATATSAIARRVTSAAAAR